MNARATHWRRKGRFSLNVNPARKLRNAGRNATFAAWVLIPAELHGVCSPRRILSEVKIASKRNIVSKLLVKPPIYMKRHLLLAAASLALLGLAACNTPSSSNAPAQPAAASANPGAGRDAQGCLPSAGYAWCASTNRCERPWELARKNGLPNTMQAFEAFEAFCRGSASGR